MEVCRKSEKTMDLDDLQPRKKLPDIVLGEDISTLSAHELETRIAQAADKARALELALFEELAQEAVSQAQSVRRAAGALAMLDVAASHAD